MKSIVMPVPEQLDKKSKDQLFSEVNETVAKTTKAKNLQSGPRGQQGKKFTVQEMWNRQRQMRSASTMMRRSNLN